MEDWLTVRLLRLFLHRLGLFIECGKGKQLKMKNYSMHTRLSPELLQSHLDSVRAVMCLLLHIAQESCAPDFGPQFDDII